jgi:hypothetical protein
MIDHQSGRMNAQMPNHRICNPPRSASFALVTPQKLFAENVQTAACSQNAPD